MRAVRQAIVSLAGLLGEPVLNQAGQEVGRVVDVVARLYGEERYPPVTGLVVRVGRRRAFLDASAIAELEHRKGYERRGWTCGSLSDDPVRCC
jgi:hypothetical protein